MKLSEKDIDPYTRALVFGFPGTGKSTLAAKLSETHNLIWLSLDNDADVLRKLPAEWQERINLVDIPDSAAFPVAAQTLMQLFKLQKGKICYDHGVWACPACSKRSPERFTHLDFTKLDSSHIVVVDTGSQLGRSILAHTLKDQPVEYKPERDDWGALRKFTEFFASQFQAARFNLIVICHAVDAELKDKSTRLIPDFGSKPMAMTFGKAFSHVIYTEMLNKKHRAYSKSTHANNIPTKSRTDFAIEALPEPSLVSLFPITKQTFVDETPSGETAPAKEVQSGQSSVAVNQNKQTAAVLTEMQKKLQALAATSGVKK
jgi:hypothetical protein